MKSKSFALLLILALLSITACSADQETPIGLGIGRMAPDFTIGLYGGESVTLSELRGKPAILNFYTTWCPPCLQEMPDFQEVFEEYGERLNLLGISVGETPAVVDEFLENSTFTYPMAYDTDGAVSYIYSIEFIPQTWVIDSEGIIIAYIPGGTNAGFLRQALSQAFAEAQSEE